MLHQIIMMVVFKQIQQLYCDDREYYFELHTPVGGDGEVHVKYTGTDDGDPDFIEYFELEEDVFFKFEEDKNGLKDFIQVNSPDCVGDDIEINNYSIEITDFNHDGGMEYGYIDTIINDKNIQFEMIQDATSGFNIEYLGSLEQNLVLKEMKKEQKIQDLK